MQQNPYAAPSVDPTPAHTSGGSGGPREWTISEALSLGWEKVWKNPAVLIGGFFMVAVLQQVITSAASALLGVATPPPGDPLAAITGTLMVMPISILVATYFTIGELRVALAAARDEPIDFGMYFSGFDRLLPGILLLILTYIGVVLGMVLLIVPGVILAFGWSLTYPLLSDTRLSIGEIFSESWSAMKGQKIRIFLFGLVACLVAVAGVLALIVGVFVALPVIVIAFAEIYMCITGRRSSES